MTNLVTCVYCDAKYNPDLKWARGYYVGTGEEFMPTTSIKSGHCPICNTKHVETGNKEQVNGYI